MTTLRIAAGLATGPSQGERSNLVRWSAAQRREIDLNGVTGGLELPAGPGRLWPLFAASSWTHVGKGTVFGLGELRITALGNPGTDDSSVPVPLATSTCTT